MFVREHVQIIKCFFSHCSIDIDIEDVFNVEYDKHQA